MTEPLPLPIPVSVTGSGGDLICDEDNDTCVFVEKTPDDDLVRLQAKNVEVMTANFEGVCHNAGFKENVVTVDDDVTLGADQKVIKATAISGSFTITLPPCAAHEGRRYSIVRTDTAVANDVIVKPTIGEKFQSVVNDQVKLGPGCNLNVQCVGSTDGWFISM